MTPNIEAALTAFTTFFATVGPFEAAIVFAGLAPNMSGAERRAIAWRATLIAGTILLVAAVAGQPLLAALGVGVPALQIAGGIILFIIGIDMVFTWRIATTQITPGEAKEATTKQDIAVFPLATPLLAGPGAMAGATLMMANADGRAAQGVVLGVLAAVMAATLVLMLLAKELHRFIGLTAQRVVGRVFGILLAALAVQSLINGFGAL